MIRRILCLPLTLVFCLGITPAESPRGLLVVPKGFPPPFVPVDNPLTAEKVLVGRYLFYDKRMSVNGTASCATCHQQRLASPTGAAAHSERPGNSTLAGP
jgi:cytochrome c peroxidase